MEGSRSFEYLGGKRYKGVHLIPSLHTSSIFLPTSKVSAMEDLFDEHERFVGMHIVFIVSLLFSLYSCSARSYHWLSRGFQLGWWNDFERPGVYYRSENKRCSLKIGRNTRVVVKQSLCIRKWGKTIGWGSSDNSCFSHIRKLLFRSHECRRQDLLQVNKCTLYWFKNFFFRQQPPLSLKIGEQEIAAIPDFACMRGQIFLLTDAVLLMTALYSLIPTG